MTKTMGKRIVSCCLAVIMIFGLIPASVFAKEWPEAPAWLSQPEQWEEPILEDGQVNSEIYGQPIQKGDWNNLKQLRAQSMAADAALDPALKIPNEQLSKITFLYINGTPYTGGNLTVTEGDNFSYTHSWAPHEVPKDQSWRDGSWFEYQLFQVPGLNLAKHIESTLVINGIKVGNYSLDYNQSTGVMTYRVVFNRYIQFFDSNTVMALLQGSGKFSNANADGNIANGEDTGKLTIDPRPQLPEVPAGPSGGTGWSPSKAPTFNNNTYAFGKGVKWNSSSDPHSIPQIEWRVVFLEQLQKTQQAFLKGGASALTTSEGYLIVEDTLDENQQFYYPEKESKYENNAPFFLEIPVIVPGTGNILNGSSNIGNGDYDGSGDVNPIITGEKFTEIDGSKADTLDKVGEIQKKVRKTPFTWTVTTDPRTRKQTLLINTGVLGTTNEKEGITWGMATQSDWPTKQLDKMIADCDAKLTAIQNGTDSPIALLDNRYAALSNLLDRAANRTDNPQKARAEVEAWQKDYRTWRSAPNVNALSPLVDSNGDLVVKLPEIVLAEGFQSWTADGSRKIADTPEYKNYLLSLKNLKGDQGTYLQNRTQYGKDWEAAKQHYQKTKDFYKDGRIFGFVVKVRSTSINTSASTYKNSVQISLDQKKWDTSDTTEVRFSSGIIGNYSLGDIVLQKADAFYDTNQTTQDIQQVEKEKAGLAGAHFQVYCGADLNGTLPELEEENLAHFLDKDASEKGNTYYYTHTGVHPDHAGLLGERTTLEVNSDGKLLLGHMTPLHDHWLVETKAPAGYYLDKTPIRVSSDAQAVIYDLIPNCSRSVILYKADSFSKNPVEGAEFTLFRVENNQRTPVTGFTSKVRNGHHSYWYDQSGTSALKTNANGELCIHGLEAGTYILQETKPAPGYLLRDPGQEYEFTLSEELPRLNNGVDNSGQKYDGDFHLLLNTKDSPLKNDPGVASLTLKKQGVGKTPLAGAGFTLFRFTGTEADWNKNPDDESKWEPVDLHEASSGVTYFKTENAIQRITIDGEGKWANVTLDASFTAENEPADPEKHGALTITDIPVGHYSIAEVKAPETYNRDYRSFYFTVDGKTAGSDKTLQLYVDTDSSQELTNNTLTNYKRKAQLALVKYDAEKGQPEILGKEVNGGWQYTDKILADGNTAGLPGAVYKLFMRRGASGSEINADPKQLADETIIANESGYDTCLAVGTTGEDGILRLSDMKGRNGVFLTSGLNPENYYLVEVKAPEGYLLDQTPIHFKLDEKVYPEDADVPAGLVMTASNRKVDYGLRLIKVDGSTVEEGKNPVGLPGAGFTVKQGETELLFIEIGAAGSYRLAKAGEEGAVATVVTGADGRLTITGLKAAIPYTFTETKTPQGFNGKGPDGQPVTVTLTTPASAQEGTLVNGVLFPKEDTQVENQRLKGKAVITKKSGETVELLQSAEFTLYKIVTTVIPPSDTDFDPENPHATRSEEVAVKTLKTDENGEAVFDGLEWEKQYFIQETKAPDGYLLDETRHFFSIDQDSFTSDGTPIPVLYTIYNNEGLLGEAKLIKADAEDPAVKLPDAHFYLEKKLGTDASGKEIWVGYGKGMYITDQAGEIDFLLPTGDYRLTEMKAPDGYVLEAMKELRFTIPKTTDGTKPPLVVIDEAGDSDGVVVNQKGESGVRIRKTLGFSNAPVPGVIFQIGWEYMDPQTLETTYVPLSFVPQGGSNYQYTTDRGAPGATSDLVTGEDGMIYAMMPADLKPENNGKLASLCCWETAAPDGLKLDSKPRPIKLIAGIYAEVNVSNQLKPEVEQSLSITIHKQDGKSKKGLPGAEFTLYWYNGTGKDAAASHIPIGTGTTDNDGNLIFNSSNASDFPGLLAGETYHIVETKAPAGYVLDETHHEVVLDAGHFDKDFHFTGAALELHNYQIRGSVSLKKVDADHPEKGLPGAEFELLRREAETGSWEHYGAWRYTTDHNGELRIENLPYGSYQLVERAAPLDYLLGDPAPSVTFQIEQNGQRIELGTITNKADPNPMRDVQVKKVAAEDTALALPGAQFQLYELAADGTYHLRQDQVYETDADGGFIIQGLPKGNYALKEIKAPTGYEIPEQDMTYFAVEMTEERVITLQIENRKSDSGVEDPSSVTVRKVWEDGGNADRPEAVLVQLYRNGEAYGVPVELSEENGWEYTWQALDNSVEWMVDEIEVPEGYRKTVTRDGNVWTITNTAEEENPGVPGQPDEPGQPTDPEDSNKPGQIPGTGDDSNLLLWLAIMSLSLSGILILPFNRAKKQKKNKS